ncbi:MAG: amidophosphoribosyltransferase, partial [Actinobacteria bacterium]|nr:amidophosphoribosyltransferase [Actinomycetota bacterium]
EIKDLIGADSLAYLSLDAVVDSTEAPRGAFCRACFDGQYPIPVEEGDRAPSKFALETL